MVVALATRIVYMILPLKWQWLSAEQIQQLDHFLFSGFVGGVLTQAGVDRWRCEVVRRIRKWRVESLELRLQ